ncbi:MAG: amidohydrolase family protein [Kiloniellales bacterium]
MPRWDPDDRPRLPIKLDAASTGEYAPLPLPPEVQWAKAMAMARAGECARRLGVSRRRFLETASGAALTFLCLNEAFAHVGQTGGYFEIPGGAALDAGDAATKLAGDEFIFDAQTHYVNPNGAWRGRNRRWEQILARYFPQGRCGLSDPVGCYSVDHFIKEIFLDSDTDMAALSFVPAPADASPLTADEAAATRAIVDAMDNSPRLLTQGLVITSLAPHQSSFDDMARMAEELKVRAWKTYTGWAADGTGWWLDDEKVGIPFIERGRELGVKIVVCHKGWPFSGYELKYSTCHDVGRVAKLFPDVNFVIYHSGYDSEVTEGPYDPKKAARGANALVKSLTDNGIPPNSNVYAELGSTWWVLMRRPTQAAHLIGKLLRYVGEDRVLWGTDCIWYGSPQDQIQAFRAFQIAEPLRERYGYPELTTEIKAKIFGRNALQAYRVKPEEVRKKADADRIGRLRVAYREDPRPSFQTYGPKTAAEFAALKRGHGGLPG